MLLAEYGVVTREYAVILYTIDTLFFLSMLLILLLWYYSFSWICSIYIHSNLGMNQNDWCYVSGFYDIDRYRISYIQLLHNYSNHQLCRDLLVSKFTVRFFILLNSRNRVHRLMSN